MDHLEADRADLGETDESLAFAGNGRDTLANGGGIIGALASGLADALDASFGQHRLSWHIQNPVLERSATDIWDQTFHF
jgi:hypothetical protein